MLVLESSFDLLIGIHFSPSISICLMVLNRVLGRCSLAFPDLFQGFVQLLMSFLALELSPASSNFAIARVSFCILELFLLLLITFVTYSCIALHLYHNALASF